MVFSSPFFLFLFLPLVLVFYYVLPLRMRNIVLLAASLFFYAWGERVYTVVMLFVVGINYVFGLLLARNFSGKSRYWTIAVCVAINLLVLSYFKYYHFFIQIVNDLLGSSFNKNIGIHLPIGISFFTFHALSYTIDVYRNEVKPQRNLTDLSLYLSLFPQLVAGPIIRYHDISDSLSQREHSETNFVYGIERFVFGLAKKMLIANQIAFYVDKIFGLPEEQLSTPLVWIAMIGYALQIYFDFSAYSDMAIGLARMFGFIFPENFRHPYTALSIQEFWRRWHISLSTWFRDYLYIPLGGSRGGERKTYRNLIIVFFLTGLWHGASYNFVIWGLIHGVFLILERNGFLKALERAPHFLRSLYVNLVVIIGWVFFRATDLPQSITFLEKMFVFENKTSADAHLNFIVDPYLIGLMVVACIFCMPVREKLFSNCFYVERTAPQMKLLMYDLIIVMAFAASIVYLAAGTYNPFIYFRF